MYKKIVIGISAVQLTALAAQAGLVKTNNFTAPMPIVDTSATLIPAGTGFVATGSFNIASGNFANNTFAQLAAAFTQFGSSWKFGDGGGGGLDGFFGNNFSAPINAGNPLIGQNIDLVLGNGVDIASSTELAVFRVTTDGAGAEDLSKFAADAPNFVADIALDGTLGRGDVELGSLVANVPVNIPGQGTQLFRGLELYNPIPEPSSVALFGLAGAAFFLRRRR